MKHSTLSDEQLLAASASGDQSAWDALIQRHGGRLYRFLGRMSGQAHADQLFLELWVEFFQLRSRWTTGTKVSTALFAMAARLASSREPDLGALNIAAHVQPDAASLDARGARLDAGIAALPLAERSCLLLCFADAFSFDEAGLVLSLPAEQVKLLSANAYLSLSRALGPDFLEQGLA